MRHEFFAVHLLRGSCWGSLDPGGGVGRWFASGLVVRTIPADVSRLFTSEAKAFLHHFGSL